MKSYKLNILVFTLVIFLLGMINILNTNKPILSELENRALKERPQFSFQSLVKGNFFKEFDEYFADTFVFRYQFIQIGAGFNYYKGVRNDENVQLVSNYGDNLDGGQAMNSDSIDIKHENEEPVTILFLNDKALTIHRFYPEKAENYAEALNRFAAKLDNEVKVFSLLVPDQIAFIDNEKYKGLSDSQDKTIAYVNSKLEERITPINVYSTLEANREQYLYFRTDHHWTSLGAYYAYTAMMDQLGISFYDVNSYDTILFSEFLGSRYALNQKLGSYPDTLQVLKHKETESFQYFVFQNGEYVQADLFDMKYAQEQNKYAIFLGGDKPLSKITSNNENGKKLLVIKDSYGNAFIPFLIPHYEEIYIVDPRHNTESVYGLIEENRINEVLFLNTIHATSKNGIPQILDQLSK